MFEDEYGNKFTQCINCENLYLIDSSDSTIPLSYCSIKCEDEYKEFVEDLYNLRKI